MKRCMQVWNNAMRCALKVQFWRINNGVLVLIAPLVLLATLRFIISSFYHLEISYIFTLIVKALVQLKGDLVIWKNRPNKTYLISIYDVPTCRCKYATFMDAGLSSRMCSWLWFQGQLVLFKRFWTSWNIKQGEHALESVHDHQLEADLERVLQVYLTPNR